MLISMFIVVALSLVVPAWSQVDPPASSTSGGVTDVGITAAYLVEVARGNISGQSIWHAICQREDMGTTATGEDCWQGNKLTPAPTSHTTIPTPAAGGEQMTVVSEDAADTSAGTGVRAVRIHYLDASGDQQTEDVVLNGTTGVNTVATDIRYINDFHALAPVGSNGVAEGHIKIYKTGSVGLVYNMIAAGGNKSLVIHRMVPAGHTLVLFQWHTAEAQGKRVAARIRSTDMYGTLIEGVFLFKDIVYMKQDTSGLIGLYTLVPAFSIVKVSFWPDQPAGEASASWTGILIED